MWGERVMSDNLIRRNEEQDEIKFKTDAKCGNSTNFVSSGV